MRMGYTAAELILVLTFWAALYKLLRPLQRALERLLAELFCRGASRQRVIDVETVSTRKRRE